MEGYFKYKRIDERAKAPRQTSSGNAGYDLYAIFDGDFIMIKPNRSALLKTGLSVEIPEGYGMFVCNRGSIGSKGLVYGAHVIDSIYRGEVFIDLHNISDKTIFISDRDFNQIRESILKEIDDVVDYLPEETVSHVRSWLARSENFIVINASKPITQVAIIPTMNWVPEETVELSESDRGDGCLGSTDK